MRAQIIRGTTTDGEVHPNMAHHRIARLPSRMVRDALASLAVVITAVAAAPAIDANAATPTGRWSGSGHGNHNFVGHIGNGKFNKNNFSINSPTFVRGSQEISNQNIGGQNPTQAVLCKRKFRHCRVVQRIVTWDP